MLDLNSQVKDTHWEISAAEPNVYFHVTRNCNSLTETQFYVRLSLFIRDWKWFMFVWKKWIIAWKFPFWSSGSGTVSVPGSVPRSVTDSFPGSVSGLIPGSVSGVVGELPWKTKTMRYWSGLFINKLVRWLTDGCVGPCCKYYNINSTILNILIIDDDDNDGEIDIYCEWLRRWQWCYNLVNDRTPRVCYKRVDYAPCYFTYMICLPLLSELAMKSLAVV